MASTINAKNTSTGVVITPDASGQLELQTADTTRMTIDSSGNVGIGTSSPTYKLQMSGGNVAFSNTAGNVCNVEIAGNGNTPGTNSFVIQQATTSDTLLWNRANANLTFGTNATERMRIDSSGNVLVNQTTVDGEIGTTPTKNAYSFNTVDGFRISCTGTNYFNRANDGDIMKFRRNGTDKGYISVNSTSTTYSTTSDYRLKDNVTLMTGALSTVAQLNPVTYTWRADGSSGQGFIAHELQSIIPDAVVGEKDAVDADGNPVYQGIDTSFLVATLTAAIQELKAELDTVKAELATLKGTA